MGYVARSSLQFIINHVVLPPKLPLRAEEPSISRAAERDLIDLVLKQVQLYRCRNAYDIFSLDRAWAVIEAMLIRLRDLTATSSLSAETLVQTFDSLQLSGESMRLIISVYVF